MISMAYGNQIAAEARRKKQMLDRKLALLRQQQEREQNKSKDYYNDGYGS